jgi:hypothetical protein
MPDHAEVGLKIRNIATATVLAPWSNRAMQHTLVVAHRFGVVLHFLQTLRRSEFAFAPDMISQLDKLAVAKGRTAIRRDGPSDWRDSASRKPALNLRRADSIRLFAGVYRLRILRPLQVRSLYLASSHVHGLNAFSRLGVQLALLRSALRLSGDCASPAYLSHELHHAEGEPGWRNSRMGVPSSPGACGVAFFCLRMGLLVFQTVVQIARVFTSPGLCIGVLSQWREHPALGGSPSPHADAIVANAAIVTRGLLF